LGQIHPPSSASGLTARPFRSSSGPNCSCPECDQFDFVRAIPLQYRTVDYDPFSKSQLASRNEPQVLKWCKFGHVTPEILWERNHRSPPRSFRCSAGQTCSYPECDSVQLLPLKWRSLCFLLGVGGMGSPGSVSKVPNKSEPPSLSEPALRVRSIRPFQLCTGVWRSPESGTLWYRGTSLIRNSPHP
jgi:hypothetical protein